MSTQQPDLEFDSLVRAAVHLPNWLQLRNEDPLVQLHTKFWGKNLTYEESVLSDNQTHTESGLSDGDQCMDVDDDGDFVPGCAILNIGIDDLPFEKIWIRADYIRIYDFLGSRETPLVRNRLAPAAVVTGQPGIGDSSLSIRNTITHIRLCMKGRVYGYIMPCADAS
jgi:hypothetical protein